jgi:hypothetical protein
VKSPQWGRGEYHFAGDYSGHLNNAGETVAIITADGDEVRTFRYDNGTAKALADHSRWRRDFANTHQPKDQLEPCIGGQLARQLQQCSLGKGDKLPAAL